MSTGATKLNIPFVKQINDYFCGPASLQMIFEYFNCGRKQCELARSMDTKEHVGTKKNKMVEAVYENDLHYYEKNNSDFEEVSYLLKNNVPVIVNFIEPTDNESHYAVVAGLTDKEIIFSDPWNGKDFKMVREDFLKRWYGHEDKRKRWILAIHKKEFSGCKCNMK
jgi:predicted double-glycine peptidase